MATGNKAHTATKKRIAEKYCAIINSTEHPDVFNDELAVEVETTASLATGVRRLMREADFSRPLYVAVTNLEGIEDALRLTEGTEIGVMDPQGNILKEAGEEVQTEDAVAS